MDTTATFWEELFSGLLLVKFQLSQLTLIQVDRYDAKVSQASQLAYLPKAPGLSCAKPVDHRLGAQFPQTWTASSLRSIDPEYNIQYVGIPVQVSTNNLHPF